MNKQGCYIKYKNPSGYFCWIENFTNLRYQIVPWIDAFNEARKAESEGTAKVVYHHHGHHEVLHLILDDKDGQTWHYLLVGEAYLLNNSGGTIEVLKRKG